MSLSSFHPAYAQLLVATQAQMTCPSPDTLKGVEEEKQADTHDTHQQLHLSLAGPPPTPARPLPALSFPSSSSTSLAFSSLPPLLSSAVSGAVGCRCALLLPHVQSLHSALVSYELQWNASLLSLSASVDRGGMEREALERRWKREEVDYRRRVTAQLDDVREELQQQIEGVRLLLASQAQLHNSHTPPAPAPPPPPPPPSSTLPPPLTAEVSGLQASLSSALSALHVEREERLRLSQRMAAMEAAMRAAAEGRDREEKERTERGERERRGAEAERRVREEAQGAALSRVEQGRQATVALVTAATRRVEEVEGRLTAVESAVGERMEEVRQQMRQLVDHTTAAQRRLEAVERSISAAGSGEGGRPYPPAVERPTAAAAKWTQPMQPTEAEAESTAVAEGKPAPSMTNQTAAAAAPPSASPPSPSPPLTAPPPSAAPSSELSLAASSSSTSSLTVATSAPTSSIPYNLFVRLWNLPVDVEGRNHPIAALFVPSAPSPPSFSSLSPSSPSFTYVSQTDWMRDSVDPVFQQALLWDWCEGQEWLKLSVYDVESENVRDEDRLGSVVIPTAALRAAARDESAAAAALAAAAGAELAPLPSSAVGCPPSGLTFALRHEDAAKQALLSSVVLMVECEADASTPRPPAPYAAPLRPALSLLVSCTGLPCRPPSLPNPIAAVFLQVESDGSWVYGGQSEWLRGESTPVFEQGMAVDDDEKDEEGMRRVRVSLYDVDTEEVRDEDRVGSVTLSMQQLRRALESGEEVELELEHEDAQQTERLRDSHCRILLQVLRAEDSDQQQEEPQPQLQGKGQGKQEESVHTDSSSSSSSSSEVKQAEAEDERSEEGGAEETQSSSDEEEEEEGGIESAHRGRAEPPRVAAVGRGSSPPLLSRLATAESVDVDVDVGIELDLDSDEDIAEDIEAVDDAADGHYSPSSHATAASHHRP